MNLSDIKDKIDKYFDNISADKLHEIALKYKLIKMVKKEFKVGETFQCGLIKLKCIEYTGSRYCCDECFIGWGCRREIFGSCSKEVREDKTDVIFVRVD